MAGKEARYYFGADLRMLACSLLSPEGLLVWSAHSPDLKLAHIHGRVVLVGSPTEVQMERGFGTRATSRTTWVVS